MDNLISVCPDTVVRFKSTTVRSYAIWSVGGDDYEEKKGEQWSVGDRIGFKANPNNISLYVNGTEVAVVPLRGTIEHFHVRLELLIGCNVQLLH